MLKTNIFSISTVNALTSTKKKKNPNQPSIKKNIILFLFLSLLVNDFVNL